MNPVAQDQNPSDADVAKDCLSGSADAFGLLIDRYEKPIYNLCYRMTGSREDAADLAQDAFLKAFQSLSRYQPGQKFFSWLYTIALNQCRNHLRRKKILHFFSLDQSPDPGEKKVPVEYPGSLKSPEEELEEGEKGTLLKNLIDTLPPKPKSLMVLKYNDHLSDSEICEITGITINNLRVQVHQAKQKLFEEYRKRFPVDPSK